MQFRSINSYQYLTQGIFYYLSVDNWVVLSLEPSQIPIMVLLIPLISIDHVAMILKFETDPDEIFFVDSTQSRGVSIQKWSDIRKYLGDFFEQVVLRHLEVKRD